MSEPLSDKWFEEREKRLLDSWQDNGRPDHNLAVLRSVAAEAMREAADIVSGFYDAAIIEAAILRRAEEIEKGGGE